MTWDDEDELTRLELDLRGRLADAGVVVAPVTEIAYRPADVLLSSASVSPQQLTELLRQVRPKVVFVTTSPFDPSEIESDDSEIRAAGEERAGELTRLSLMWAADGIIYDWFAVADWYDELLTEAELSAYQARGIDQVERELGNQRNADAHQELMAAVMSSPEFRGASTNRRTAQVKIIMDAQPGLVDDLWFPLEFTKRARAAAAVEVARFEGELESDDDVLSQIAAELAGGRPVNQQRMRVAEILRSRADGWALSEIFVEKMRLKALAR